LTNREVIHTTKKRCCLFAHYDKDNIVDPYVLRYIDALQPFTSHFVFITTSQLDETEQSKLEQRNISVICRENVGYDFYSWKVGLESVDLSQFNELLQVNDSCYAPLFSFNDIFEKMEEEKCDFWSITRSHYYGKHAQSYFVCYREPIIRNLKFLKFWKEMVPLKEKRQVIVNYEAGISRMLLAQKYSMQQYFSITLRHYARTFFRNLALKLSTTRNLNPYKYFRAIILSNPTFHFYREMLDAKVPLIKIALLRGDPYFVKPTDLSSVSGIDEQTIQNIREHQARLGHIDTIEAWLPKAKSPT
jgi:rhamnosyltransferase